MVCIFNGRKARVVHEIEDEDIATGKPTSDSSESVSHIHYVVRTRYMDVTSTWPFIAKPKSKITLLCQKAVEKMNFPCANFGPDDSRQLNNKYFENVIEKNT